MEESPYSKRITQHRESSLFRKYVFDREQGKCLGRTAISWCQIISFYVMFYSFLAGFWALCFYVFMSNLMADYQHRPKYILNQSRIAGFGSEGVKPGLSIVPRLPQAFDDDYGRHYNWVMKDNSISFNNPWISGIMSYFEKHEEVENGTSCEANDNNYHENDTCLYNNDELGPICSKYPYGYFMDAEITPCIFFKINRIYLFKPEPFNVSMLGQTKDHLPSWYDRDILKSRILNEPRKIYVDCHGKSKEENDKIKGNIRYFPNDFGISFRYFPYHKVNVGNRLKGPLLAIQLLRDFPRDEKIRIECSAFYKNVIHNRKKKQGVVQFSIQITSK